MRKVVSFSILYFYFTYFFIEENEVYILVKKGSVKRGIERILVSAKNVINKCIIYIYI